MSTTNPPPDLDSLVRAHLEREAERIDPRPHFERIKAALNPATPASVLPRPSRRRWLWSGAAAAAVVLAFLCGFELAPIRIGPEALVMESQRVEQIRGFLQELPEPVRNAFLLFRTEDLDQESIARRLGITDRMVRNHITRALMYCRLRLEGLAPADAMARLKAGPSR